MSLPSKGSSQQAHASILRPFVPFDGIPSDVVTIFLAGSTTSQDDPDWRTRLSDAIADLPIVILNPKNPAWDRTWKESFEDERWVAQHRWEVSAREMADVVVFCFEAGTDAPISLLELGLTLGCHHRSSREVVFAARNYTRRAYVESACQAQDIVVHDDEGEFVNDVRATIQDSLTQQHGLRMVGQEQETS